MMIDKTCNYYILIKTNNLCVRDHLIYSSNVHDDEDVVIDDDDDDLESICVDECKL